MARLRPVWIPAATLVALLPVLAGLGVWQLQRAEQKQVLQQEYDQRAHEVPQPIGAELQSAAALRFRHVAARGRYDPDYQVLVDNRVHQGVAGYHVVTPLKLEGSDTRVLVNRGWIPLGTSREQLPSIETPVGVTEPVGVVTLPAEEIFTLGGPTPREQGWQPVWSHLDMKRYAAAVPFPVQPVVLLLDANERHGFIRAWPRPDARMAMHQGYAFMWFALAGLVAVIFVLTMRRKRRRQKRTA